MKSVNVTGLAWVNINAESSTPEGSPFRLYNSSSSWCFLYEGVSPPTRESKDFSTISTAFYGTDSCYIKEGASTIWALCQGVDRSSTLTVDFASGNILRGTDQEGLPDGVSVGRRAINVQTYTESNSKLGLQHEGSTLFTLAGSASNDTIFLTGDLPVSLKGRVLGYTGDGVTAEIFTGATYSGGVSAPYQNASDINPVTGLSQIIVGATITDEGSLAFAPNHLIGNTSNQGKGTASAVAGRESLLKPNTAYLFRITSLDTASQEVTSLLTWYEGLLDLPLGVS